MTWTFYVIKTPDNYYFAGRFNHFLEPTFAERICDAKFYEDKGVVEIILNSIRKAIKDSPESHYHNLRIHRVDISLYGN